MSLLALLVLRVGVAMAIDAVADSHLVSDVQEALPADDACQDSIA